ncbi:MAG: DEAD/DEAH box helicase family protein [Bacteroidales bacterium]|nr:DEAD/DEAH box helicase family protein [Bacteroidales bacterium]
MSKPDETYMEEHIEKYLTSAPKATIEQYVSGLASEPIEGYESEDREYRKLGNELYDERLALVPEELVSFVRSTQPKEWRKLVERTGGIAQATRRLAERVSKEIDQHGTINVFRMDKLDASEGAHISLIYPRPANNKTSAHIELYDKNRLGIMRQVHYSEKDKGAPHRLAIDMVIFLNGLPIITMELKNELTGQCHHNAIMQYMRDRKVAGEKLLEFKRCLVHFAVGTEQVFMTTKLEGEDTYFLPYNQTFANIGVESKGYRTDYLWKDVLRRESIIDLVSNYVNLYTVIKKVYNPDTGQLKDKKSTSLIFPRWHQRRAVKNLLADVHKRGSGHNYLIEHSAGSGKSHTITWLAFRLSSLYQNYTDEDTLFDSIIVVNDRVALDTQMQRNFKQFEHTNGEVCYIDDKCTSQDLRKAIEERRRIIVTTLQKFPVIAEDVTKYPKRKFAVIIDEAHSSQSGTAARQMRKALSLEEAEVADNRVAAQEEDPIDKLAYRIEADLSATGPHRNVSFFAFTATPKPKTIEIFCERENGTKEPFDLYSLEDAINEGFVLNPIENVMSFKRYYKLMRNQDVPDKEHNRKKTMALLNSFVDVTPTAIERKSRIMVEHFVSQTSKEIDGEARAMLVTRSRLHAVRYKLEFDKIMQEMRLPYKALVAFSGVVKDGDMEYTEQSMNNLPNKTSIPEALKLPQFRILIVADKYQTGFDEPLMHTMFVDKKLGGTSTVQTLSRLNRKYGNKKTSTLVLDFVNNTKDLRADFMRFYGKNYMPEENETDADSLLQIKSKILNDENYRGIITAKDLDDFASIRWSDDWETRKEEVYPILDRVVDRAKQLSRAPEDLYLEFRKDCQAYKSLFNLLSHIKRFYDPELLKLYEFVALLVMKLRIENAKMTEAEKREICDGTLLESYKIKFDGLKKIALESNDSEEKGMGSGRTTVPPQDDYEFLSVIIKTLNDMFGLDLTEDDKVDIQRLREKVTSNEELLLYFNSDNSRDNIRDRFNEEVDNELLEFINSKLELYNKLTEDRVNTLFKQLWFNELYDALVRGIRVG